MTALNYADKIAIGAGQATKVYVGSTQAWPRFVPTSISGCVIWLDASKLALANGAAVSSWTNLGSGPQPTLFGSGAPVFRTNALNTIMPVVRQTGTQGKFRFAGTGVDKEYTLALVARKWSATTGRLFSTPPANNVLFGWWGDRIDLTHNSGWLAPDIVTPGTTAWKLYSADQTATSARFFSNGALLRSSTTAASGLGGALWFGGYDDTTEFGDGEYAEVILYNRKLSDAERQAVEKYLREKWIGGTPLWSPSDLGANLTAWFDSSDLATVQLAGQGVNNWVNKKSGGTMTLTQSVNDTYRPTIQGNGVSFALAQGMNATGGPASFDVFVLGQPNPPAADPVNWRTLLRSASCHEIIVEDKSPRLGTYNGGFFNAVVGLVSPNNMTSYTTPAPYVASESNPYAGYPAWYSWDGNASTYSHSANPTTTEAYWIKIDLGSAKYVTGYTYQVRPEANSPQQWKDWLFQGSNDNVNWTTVDTVTNNPIQATGSAVVGYACDNPGTYRYYRWYVTAGQNYSPPYAAAAALDLYEGLTWPAVDGLCFARVAPSTVVQISRDGGVLRSTGTTLPATSAATTMFGCYMGTPPTQGFGAVREVIFVPNNLESERQRIEGYLSHKWGLQTLLPAGHPYKAAPP